MKWKTIGFAKVNIIVSERYVFLHKLIRSLNDFCPLFQPFLSSNEPDSEMYQSVASEGIGTFSYERVRTPLEHQVSSIFVNYLFWLMIHRHRATTDKPPRTKKIPWGWNNLIRFPINKQVSKQSWGEHRSAFSYFIVWSFSDLFCFRNTNFELDLVCSVNSFFESRVLN